jgi:protocatechuate 3,4-dioxygenase beta subunit
VRDDAGSAPELRGDRRQPAGALRRAELASVPADSGCTLTGRVVHSEEGEETDARPVLPRAGVSVRLSITVEGLDPILRELQTEPDGRFSFAALTPGAKLRLEVDEPGSALIAVAFALPEPQGGRRVDLGDVYLDPAHALRVRVVDATGSPIAGARVQVRPSSALQGLDSADIDTCLRELEPDGGGEYVLERIPPGYHPVYATAPGRVALHRDLETPHGEPHVVELERARRITGRVLTAGGEPIAGARLRSGQADDRFAPATLADASGWFDFDNAELKGLQLRATADGFTEVSRWVDEDTDQFEFHLVREAVVSGRVVREEDGGAIESAYVSVADVRADRHSRASAYAYTDSSGRFELRKVPPGDYQLEARSEDRVPVAQHLGPVAAGERVVDVIVRLPPGLRLRGRVTDMATGEPIAGVRLDFLQAQEPASPNVKGQRESQIDGCFELRGLASGPVEIQTEAEAYLEVLTTVEVQADESPELDLRLVRGGVVEGRVLGPEGAGLEGVDVSLLATNTGTGRSASTDEGGHFRFDGLAADSYRLSIAHDEFAFEEREGIEVAPGRDAVGIEVRLQPWHGAVVRGRVLGLDSRAFVRALVTASRVEISGDKDEPRRFEREVPEYASVNSDGTYELRGLFPETYLVQAYAYGRPPSREATVTVEERQVVDGIDLVFEPGFTLSGRVVGSEGKGLAGATVALTVGGYRSHSFELDCDEEGRFRSEGLAAGRGWITAQCQGHRPRRLRVSVPTTGVTVALEPLARVWGRVVADGVETPLRGSVIVSSWPARLRDWSRDFTIDHAGHFQAAVPAGPCEMYANVAGFAAAEARLDLTPGETREVIVELQAAGRVSASVVSGATGQPLDDVIVRIELGAAPSLWSRYSGTDTTGEVLVEDVPPGVVRITAWHPKHALARIDGIRVEAGRTTAVRIELEPASGVRGTVVKDGERVAGARVRLRKPDGGGETAVLTGMDGEFEAAGLEPGEYDVVVDPDSRQPAALLSTYVEEERFTKVDVNLSAVRLVGRVSAGGKPIGGAFVAAKELDTDNFAGCASTGENGDYDMTLPGPGEYELKVESEEAVFQADLVIPRDAHEVRHDVEIESAR